MRVLIRRRANRHIDHIIILIDFIESTHALGHTDLGKLPIINAGVSRIRDLPGIALVIHRILGPGLEDDLNIFLEDIAVMLIVHNILVGNVEPALGKARANGRLVVLGRGRRLGRGGAVMLAEHIGPAALIPARKADKAAALAQVIDDRGFFSHADRILNAHHIAKLAHAHILGNRRPVGIHDGRCGTNLITFRPEVMLNGGHAPEMQVVSGHDDFMPALNRFLIAFLVAADGTKRFALGLVLRMDDRVGLQNWFYHEFVSPRICSPHRRLLTVTVLVSIM